MKPLQITQLLYYGSQIIGKLNKKKVKTPLSISTFFYVFVHIFE